MNNKNETKKLFTNPLNLLPWTIKQLDCWRWVVELEAHRTIILDSPENKKFEETLATFIELVADSDCPSSPEPLQAIRTAADVFRDEVIRMAPHLRAPVKTLNTGVNLLDLKDAYPGDTRVTALDWAWAQACRSLGAALAQYLFSTQGQRGLDFVSPRTVLLDALHSSRMSQLPRPALEAVEYGCLSLWENVYPTALQERLENNPDADIPADWNLAVSTVSAVLNAGRLRWIKIQPGFYTANAIDDARKLSLFEKGTIRVKEEFTCQGLYFPDQTGIEMIAVSRQDLKKHATLIGYGGVYDVTETGSMAENMRQIKTGEAVQVLGLFGEYSSSHSWIVMSKASEELIDALDAAGFNPHD